MRRSTSHGSEGGASGSRGRWSFRRAWGGGKRSRFPAWRLATACSILIAGCGSFHPQPLDKVGFEQRAQSSTDGQVTVSVTALSEEEARGALGVDLAGAGIQPVWVKVENREAIGYVITPIVMDHDYFSPMEAAWQATWLAFGRDQRPHRRVFPRAAPARPSRARRDRLRICVYQSR
jgi:hypothetical protein